MPTKTKQMKLGVYYSSKLDRIIVVESFYSWIVQFYMSERSRHLRCWHPNTMKELGFKWIGEL